MSVGTVTVTSPPTSVHAKSAVREPVRVFFATFCFQVLARLIVTGIPASVTQASSVDASPVTPFVAGDSSLGTAGTVVVWRWWSWAPSLSSTPRSVIVGMARRMATSSVSSDEPAFVQTPFTLRNRVPLPVIVSVVVVSLAILSRRTRWLVRPSMSTLPVVVVFAEPSFVRASRETFAVRSGSAIVAAVRAATSTGVGDGVAAGAAEAAAVATGSCDGAGVTAGPLGPVVGPVEPQAATTTARTAINAVARMVRMVSPSLPSNRWRDSTCSIARPGPVDASRAPRHDRPMDDDLDAREAARIRRRDHDADAARRDLMRPGMGKVFKQITDKWGDNAAQDPKPGRKPARG